MATTVVLAVCLDTLLPWTQDSALRSAGYFFVPANSIKEAINHFKAGDFDLVLLGNAISTETRERLTFLIRATGSNVPVACIAGSSGHHDAFADATFEQNSCQLPDRLRDLLKSKTRTRPMPAILYNPAT
jgi:DNA-binding NtrC family response regulator